MGRQLNPQELDELIGVYAIDAVDDADEREQVESWIDRSPAAAAELASLRETAALLAHAGADAPEGVWTRIEEALSAEPPPLTLPTDRVVSLDTARRRRRPALRIGAGIAAASAAAAAITAVVFDNRMSDQEQRLAQVARSIEHDGIRQAAMAAMASPDARTIRFTSDDGVDATVVMTPDGAGFFMAEDLPRLADGRTYQLWALTGDSEHPDMVSAGVLGPNASVVPFHGPPGAMGFAITEEDESGAAQPTSAPVLSGRFA